MPFEYAASLNSLTPRAQASVWGYVATVAKYLYDWGTPVTGGKTLWQMALNGDDRVRYIAENEQTAVLDVLAHFYNCAPLDVIRVPGCGEHDASLRLASLAKQKREEAFATHEEMMREPSAIAAE